MRVLALILVASSASAAPDRILKHDTGKISGKQAMQASGQGVTFRAPAGEWYIRSVLVYGSGYGGAHAHPFDVSVCDAKQRTQIHAPKVRKHFREGLFEWIEIPLPPQPRIKGKFSVILDVRPTRKRGIYIGYCDVGRSHSFYGRAGGKWRPFRKDKEWMIRVRMTQRKGLWLFNSKDWSEPAAIRERRGRETSIVWDATQEFTDRNLDAKAPLDTLDQRGQAYLLDWGVVFVTSRDLKPTAQREPSDIRALPLWDALHQRFVDLAVKDQAVKAAVEDIVRWFEAELVWKPKAPSRKIALAADNVLGRDALDLLLVPFGYTWTLSRNRVVVEN